VPVAAASSLMRLLRSCGLERYTDELKHYNLDGLQQLLTQDKDALLDVLIDASMKSADRKTFMKALEHERAYPSLHEDTVASGSLRYMLGPAFLKGSGRSIATSGDLQVNQDVLLSALEQLASSKKDTIQR